MDIIPAIDIIRGKTVRLVEGNFRLQTVYPESPVEFAKKWASFGVGMIHVVDLDGARAGEPKHLEVVRDIAASVKSSVEFGGGIRDEHSLKAVLQTGVRYAVVGTKALDDAFMKVIAEKYIDRVVISIDAKKGYVLTKGWLDSSEIRASDLIKTLEAAGFKRINFTDVSRDGTLQGPDIDQIQRVLAATNVSVVVAGGISSVADILNLKSIHKGNLAGVIIGKALYEGRVDLADAIKAAQ